jgi:hypothetical protein
MSQRNCTSTTKAGRLAKAKEFLSAAELLGTDEQLSDACVSMCVEAGIAASDVICRARVGAYAQGQNHNEAVELLRRASNDDKHATHLVTLLSVKDKTQYSAIPVSSTHRTKALRAARALVEAAERA